MEILSTGDKIKRARVYEGITLKELCEDKISISKMSCIENGKIEPEKEIVEHIANRLNIDYDYLVESVRNQIEENINKIDEGSISEKNLIGELDYNLKYALKCDYYDLAFLLTHKLFDIYASNDDKEDMQLIISLYYDLFQKNISEENMFIYYKDMATFFYKAKECNESINYFNKIEELLEKRTDINDEAFVLNCYNLGLCYLEIERYNEAYDHFMKSIKNIDVVKCNIKRGQIYHSFSNLGILLKKDDNEKYIAKSYEYSKDNHGILAKYKSDNGRSYIESGNVECGKLEIHEALRLLNDNKNEEFLEVLLSCIDTLFKNKQYDVVAELVDEALNTSICLNNTKLIEKAYYFKGMLLQKNGQYIQAETYMNIATDYYLKYSNKVETFERYNEMAELYYNLGELRDALKYFTLGMNLKID